MNRVLSIAALAIFTATLISCDRYYTCKCTTTEAGVSKTDTIEKPFRARSKNDANENCATMQSKYNVSKPGVTKCVTE